MEWPGAEYLGTSTGTWSAWVWDAEERPVGEAVLTSESLQWSQLLKKDGGGGETQANLNS